MIAFPPHPAPPPAPRARAEPVPTSNGGDWLGPLAGWELLRTARRGDPFRARLAAAGLLAAALAAVGWWSFTAAFWDSLLLGPAPRVAREELAGFAGAFATVVVVAQVAVVFLLTPGYAAAGFAEEKDRHTLTLLLATPLTDGELVRGKFAARAAGVLAVTAVPVPVLLYVLPSGGVNPVAVAAAYALLGSAVLFLAALGALAGCLAADLNRAALLAYAWTAGYALLTANPLAGDALPFGLVFVLAGGSPGALAAQIVLAAIYTAAHLAAAALVLASAARGLRPSAEPPDAAKLKAAAKPLDLAPPGPPPPEVDPALYVAAPFFAPPVSKPAPPRPVLLDDDPIGWKERYVTGTLPVLEDEGARRFGEKLGRLARKSAGWAIAVAALLVVVQGGRSEPLLFLFLLLGGAVVAAAELTAVGAPAAVTIARERRKGTLDGLLSLPADRAEILAAKRAACADRLSWWGVAAAGGTWMGFASQGLVPACLAVGVLVVGGGFVIAYGMRLSARHNDTAPALRRLLPVVGFVAALPSLVWLAAWEIVPRSVRSGGVLGPVWLDAVLLAVVAGLRAAAAGLRRTVLRELESGEAPPRPRRPRTAR